MNTPHDHETDPDDFEARLRRGLQSTTIDLPAARGPAAAANRAHERSRRRRTAVVSVAAVALVGGLAAPSLIGDEGDTGVNTNIAAPIDADGPELDWRVGDDGLSRVPSADEGTDGFYALSTAPGTTYDEYPNGDAPRALYRWSDGVWQPIELDGDDPNVAKVSERDGTLYALSTAADTGAPVGSVSTDGGESWTPVPLDGIEPPSDDVAWTMSVGIELASTADTTIAVVSTRFAPPGDDLFDELGGDPQPGHGYYWHTSEAGVELVEYSENLEESSESVLDGSGPATDAEGADDDTEETETVVRTIPWSELGVAGIEATSSVTTYRADGDVWSPISDGPAPGIGSGSLTSTDSGFLVETNGSESASAQVFHSTDGAAWHPVSTPEGDRDTVLAPDGSLLSVDGAGASIDGYPVSVSTDLGASWSPIDLSSLAPDMAGAVEVSVRASSGPLGVALFVHNFDGEDPSSRLLFSTDLQSWTVTDLDVLLPEDTPYLVEVLIGTDHIILQAAGPSDPDDGEPGPTATLVATPVR